jgi:hypothetical protein
MLRSVINRFFNQTSETRRASGLYSPMVCAGMLMLTCVLSACGNGNQGGNPSGNVVSISGPAAAITSFAPAAGPVGTEIIVSGNGLNQVIAAKIGSVTATFSIDSANQMRVDDVIQCTYSRVTVCAPRECAGGWAD